MAMSGRPRVIDVRRTEVQAGISVLLGAARGADLRVEDQQMRRLILLVHHTAVVDVSDFVERVRVVELQFLRRMRMLITEIALNADHSLVSGMAVETIHDSESAPLRHETETRIEHAKDDAVFKRLMEVAL